MHSEDKDTRQVLDSNGKRVSGQGLFSFQAAALKPERKLDVFQSN